MRESVESLEGALAFIYKRLARLGSPEARELARDLHKAASSADFNDDELGCDQALIALGLMEEE